MNNHALKHGHNETYMHAVIRRFCYKMQSKDPGEAESLGGGGPVLYTHWQSGRISEIRRLSLHLPARLNYSLPYSGRFEAPSWLL